MASSGPGVSNLDKLEAVLANEETYALGDLIPDVDAATGGRPRDYPNFCYVFFGAAIHIFASARHAEAELAHPHTWAFVRDIVRRRFPDTPSMWLPDKPIRSHHWRYIRTRYLTRADVWEAMRDLHEAASVSHALELGLCAPDGGGSLTHPDPGRMVFGDGKVVTPLYKAKRGTKKVNKSTGEVRTVRADPDAQSHVIGSGAQVWGNKFAWHAVRGPNVHERIILTFGHVPKGNEAKVAVEGWDRILPNLPGVQATLYDGAMHGVHNEVVIRKHGKVPISPVTAAAGGRHSGTDRIERQVRVGEGVIRRRDGSVEACQLYAEGGALGIGVVNETGDVTFVPLRRTGLKMRGPAGAHRLYGNYGVPKSEGGGTVDLVPLYITEADKARRFNRTEHLRPIPPGDPDYLRLYPRRSDIESINRGHDDHLYLRRAHSVGAARQMVDVATYALLSNSLAMHRHRAQSPRRTARAA